MAALKAVPGNLPDLVGAKFRAAKEAQELTFWPTQVFILLFNGIPVRRSFPLPPHTWQLTYLQYSVSTAIQS
jgi:hypothetical protein